MHIRGWADALVIAYVLAMFIRTYDVELFKIPTGSMTPTLVGDSASVEMDYDGNGEKDLVLFFDAVFQVFLQEKGRYTRQIWVYDVPFSVRRDLQSAARPRHDMILVNKFAYWFSPPRRGDILVFKVPNRPELDAGGDINRSNPWNPDTPIFIKRCVGVPGDTIRIAPPEFENLGPGDSGYIGRLGGSELVFKPGPATVNGDLLSSPVVFQRINHFPYGFRPQDRNAEAEEFRVPPDGVFMMGDNSANSKDSRAWGAVPMDNIKGKAIFRYWPFRKLSFLD
jgi:signal peptidase I